MEKKTEKASVANAQVATKPIITQLDAIRNNIKLGRNFKIVRKVYQSKNGKYYYSYSIFVILSGTRPYIEINLMPYSGYIAKDENYKTLVNNSSSYANLNNMYDFGMEMTLVAREESAKDGSPVIKFYATCADADGISADFEMVANTVGEKSWLLSAFAGFGRCRDFVYADLDTVQGLREAFKGALSAGETPSVEVVSD